MGHGKPSPGGPRQTSYVVITISPALSGKSAPFVVPNGTQPGPLGPGWVMDSSLPSQYHKASPRALTSSSAHN